MGTVLKAKDIVKTYNNRKVLDNVNMTISKGDIYGFIRKNRSSSSS